VLVESVVPFIANARGILFSDERATAKLQQEFLDHATTVCQDKLDQVFRIKLGLDSTVTEANERWKKLEWFEIPCPGYSYRRRRRM
jgi:hypothetical protein